MNKLGTTISMKNELRNWGRAKYLDNRGIIKKENYGANENNT